MALPNLGIENLQVFVLTGNWAWMNFEEKRSIYLKRIGIGDFPIFKTPIRNIPFALKAATIYTTLLLMQHD